MSGSRATLLLAGGAGTRLWPLSSDERPKQFLRVLEGESLIQRAAARLRQIVPDERIFISTNARYEALVREQLPFVRPGNILLEPERRNTLPAIATCCALVERQFPASTVGIFHSDHAISPDDQFVRTVDTAFRFAEQNDYLVTIGLQPTEPNSGFGYLELGGELTDGVFELRRYIEKPDRERARQLIESGHLWNGGMFLWRTGYFLGVLRNVAPEVARLAADFVDASSPGQRNAAYAAMPVLSIDYGVMEKAERIATVPASFEWSDVGTWSSVAQLTLAQPENLVLHDAANVFVSSTSSRPIAVVGLSDIIVIDAPEGLLVVDRRRTEEVTQIAKQIERRRDSK